MPKIKYINLIVIICISTVYSCYFPAKEDLFVNGDSQLVVEATITDNKEIHNYVKLSLTVNGKSKANYIPINNAEIILTNKTKKSIEKLNYTENGIYKVAKTDITTGDKCSIEIEYKGGVYSGTEVMPKKPNVKLLSIVYKDSIFSDNPGYYFYFALKKDTNKIGFYKVEITVNDTLLNKYEDLFILDDRMYQKNQVIKLPYAFQNKDKIMVNFFSINEIIYNYYYSLSSQTTNLFSNISPPSINPENNIFPDVLGCFNLTSAYSLDTIIVEKP